MQWFDHGRQRRWPLQPCFVLQCSIQRTGWEESESVTRKLLAIFWKSSGEIKMSLRNAPYLEDLISEGGIFSVGIEGHNTVVSSSQLLQTSTVSQTSGD